MIKYLGSKRTLLPHILRAVGVGAAPGALVADLFSGTSRVGHALKGAGYRVVANDHNRYAHALATCYVQADAERWAGRAAAILADLERLPGRPGYFTATFCEAARFLHPENGERVDAIREAIATMGAEPELEAILLVALMEAADRVDSTAGLQMAYMKRWAPRALKPLRLRLPALLPRPAAGPCRAHCADAEALAPDIEAELAYLDPPYNQHSYLGNYHVWETLVRWDKPETYGVARKRVDVRTRRSAFNGRRSIGPALARIVGALRCPTLVVSFNDEGWVERAELEAMLRARRPHLEVIEIPYDRYVGARIGIHNPRGEKVGTVGRLRNVEYLYVSSERRLSLSAAVPVEAVP
ncbi:DNA adenine methylase [Roseomonas sp. NAR14]|uniref:site-specific DNA-methyltransferase (adenine-specific) n=1 Tax=Roseomonas acroporae TaxID=2937791 RepID=A0A9X2BY06_9PROT|nr:DNA adenine methylase [Roseomonas acroporae]MCK8785505.1 DNA adenine methylase [Roseomonas acroporae]